jgi:transposase
MGVRWQAARVYLALGATDMRKQINALGALVQERLGLAPFSGALFVFCNRRRTTLKILWWDRNGFCLWMKRLERERFRWPEREAEVAEVASGGAGHPEGAQRASVRIDCVVKGLTGFD